MYTLIYFQQVVNEKGKELLNDQMFSVKVNMHQKKKFPSFLYLVKCKESVYWELLGEGWCCGEVGLRRVGNIEYHLKIIAGVDMGVGRLSYLGEVVRGKDKAPFRNYENKKLG